MEEVREGFVLFDQDLNIASLNRIGRAFLLLQPGEGERRNLRSLPESPGRRMVLDRLLPEAAPLQTNLPETKVSLDGAERVFRPRLLPIESDSEEYRGFLLILWDVTAENRFDEARRKFIATLSHQLKTPATSLSLSVNLLWEKLHGTDEESDDLLRMAREDCTMLATTLSDLIDASRGAIQSLTLIPRRAELTAVLRKAVRPLENQALERGIRFADELGDAAVFGRIDPVKFPWVVTNILGNALRYTKPGGTVTVRLAEVDEEILINVKDTGAGIAAVDLKRLFAPFTSLDSQPQAESLGLGLTIAREIVEAHHGEIEVSSQVGVGTEFTIRIPAVAEEEA
jgi:signal transduction histidine kinase